MNIDFSKTETFLFFRETGFYPIDIPPQTVIDNVKCNPGTIRVEDMRGNVVWEESLEGRA